MRVLVVPKWYPTAERPAFGIFCREHARAIGAEHDVVVLASYAVRRPPFALFAIVEDAGEQPRALRLQYRRPRIRVLGLPIQLLGMLVAVARLLREGWRPQIIHAHVYSAAAPAILLGRLLSAPVVVTEHYTGFQRRLLGRWELLIARFAFRHCALLAPVSESLAGELSALAPKTPVRVVGNPVDCEVFHPAEAENAATGSGGPERPRRLLCVAELTAKKGHAYLLEAIGLIAADDSPAPRLELAGGGELRERLAARARELGIDAQVHFHGEVPKSEVAQLMREADLLVLPSLHENMPCVLVESMASGLPFLATAVGGVPELFRLPAVRAHCACVPPANPAALAEAAERLLAGRPPRAEAQLRAAACAEHSYSASARSWSEIYESLA